VGILGSINPPLTVPLRAGSEEHRGNSSKLTFIVTLREQAPLLASIWALVHIAIGKRLTRFLILSSKGEGHRDHVLWDHKWKWRVRLPVRGVLPRRHGASEKKGLRIAQPAGGIINVSGLLAQYA
jgi:hypothetical protein